MQAATDWTSTNRALGRLGVYGLFTNFDYESLDQLAAREAIAYLRRIEGLGYDAVWINEALGREPFAVLGALAVSTQRMALALGIASIYARDAVAAHAGARTINDLADGRFVMGLGVSSHRAVVSGTRGHDFGAPVVTMEGYLQAYRAAPYKAHALNDEPP